MSKREPSPAQQRLWRARILTELKNGTPAEETNRIMNAMIETWQAVQAEEGVDVGPPVKVI